MEAQRFKITITNTDNETELVRTLTTLLETRAGTQPADREFGISWECLDEPFEVAENLFYLECVRKVERYEPRVEVKDMIFYHEEGVLKVHIYFTGKEAW